MRTKQGSYPAHAPAQAARLKAGRPSSLVDTGVIYCGDCLEDLRKHPGAWVDGGQGKTGGQKDTLGDRILRILSMPPPCSHPSPNRPPPSPPRSPTPVG